MNFLNPIALIGLAAAAIPIILHLLNLRKLKIVEFSTLRFLKELQKTKIRRLKLKQLILLILRTLIIIFAVLAFARPAIRSSLPVIGTYAKSSIVIILDNSFSMDVSDEFGNRFNQARNTAKTILGNLKDGDEAALIQMADYNTDTLTTLSRNIGLVKEELSKIKISNSSANLEKSLRIASRILESSKNLNREIFIITDAQRNILTSDIKDSLKLFDKPALIYFIPVGYEIKRDIRNLSIDSLNVINRIFQINKIVEVEVSIRNNSRSDMKGAIASLFFDGKRMSQRSIDVSAGEIRKISIAATPEHRGVTKAFIELEDDALNHDNRRYFGFVIPDKPKVAVIGDNQTTSFLSIALGAKLKEESYAITEFFKPSEFASINLANYEIVICAGGPYLHSDFQRLEQYIKNGGSCLFFADDASERKLFKEGVALLGFGEPNERNFSNERPAGYSSVDKIHPLFEGVFKGTTDNRTIVESPKIYIALTCSAGQAIIEIPGGIFLSESRLGDGKAFYCAVSPSLSWSSFPLTGLFPTIIYRTIIYLTAREELGKNVIAGKPLTLMLPKRFASGGNFKITDPDGIEFYKQAAVLPSGAILSFSQFKNPGVYTVNSPQNNIASVLSVNPSGSESILTPLDNDEIKSKIEKYIGEDSEIKFIENLRNIIKGIDRARTGTELWQMFLILALIAAISEMLIARATKKETESLS